MPIGDEELQDLKRIGHTKLFGKVSPKAQSAMEYLMTYGWAILVIAVVLGVLYSLGIFNPSNFAPKAAPGSCQVFRPNGPGTGYDINLQGECSNELPEYTAAFNRQTSYIDVGNSTDSQFGSNTIFTISAWIYIKQCPLAGNGGGIVAHGSGSYTFYVQDISGVCYLEWAKSGTANIGNGPTIQTGSWVNAVAVNYVNSNVILYINGMQSGPYGFAYTYAYTQDLRIGSSESDANGYIFNGSISNVQLYNASLGPASVNAIYAEGIGGAPIVPQNLVGWWPLNGNANDYSGNNNNGVPTNVIFTGTWQNGYTAP